MTTRHRPVQTTRYAPRIRCCGGCLKMALPGDLEPMEATAMPTGPTFVVVGASLGGARAAEALRDEGFDGQIVLIGAEAHHPYERPPLSKGYLLASGETIGYDKLLLTTGAVPVRLPVPGADANGVLTLRTVDDSELLRETLA